MRIINWKKRAKLLALNYKCLEAELEERGFDMSPKNPLVEKILRGK